MNDLETLKKVRTRGIIGLVFLIVAWLSLIIGLALIITNQAAFGSINLSLLWVGVAFVIVFIISLIVASIMNFVDSLIILCHNWKNEEVEESKLLWGLLSLFLISQIGIIIFANKSIKIIEIK